MPESQAEPLSELGLGIAKWILSTVGQKPDVANSVTTPDYSVPLACSWPELGPFPYISSVACSQRTERHEANQPSGPWASPDAGRQSEQVPDLLF